MEHRVERSIAFDRYEDAAKRGADLRNPFSKREERFRR